MATPSKAGFTAGPWHVEECEQCPERGRIYVHARGWLDPNELIVEACRTDRDVDNGDVAEAEANARLIAEAGTVAHETGLTPRQLADAYTTLRAGSKAAVEAWNTERAELAERCKELEAALVGVTDLYCELANSGDAGFWDPEKVDEVIAARTALAKTGGAA